MTDPTESAAHSDQLRFAAEIIRTSARRLAGRAAAQFIERDEASGERFGDHGMETWRDVLGIRLQALATALDEGDPSIFAEDLRWHRDVAIARGLTSDDVERVLDDLANVTVESTPPALQDPVRNLFETARAAARDERAIAEERPLGPNAERLFDLALVGDVRGARHFLLDGIRSGDLTIEQAVLECVLPAAREAGRRWHEGQLGVAVEHVISSTLRTALYAVATEVTAYEPMGKSIFLASVSGDAHDLGLIAFAILLEADGWRVVNAGADTPIEEIEQTAKSYACDLIALSATLLPHRSVIARFLERKETDTPVLIGGRAFRTDEDAKNLGASAYSPDLASGVAAARRLVDA